MGHHPSSPRRRIIDTPKESRLTEQVRATGLTLDDYAHLQMVAESGGVEAVRRLLKTPNYQDGLTTLWEINRLDMSCEFAVLNPKYRTLFTEAEKREGRKRLKAMNYVPKFD